jgi:hypothetical protein
LSENLLNRLAFPLHTLVADEQAAGFEVDRLADGRRAPNDRYQSVTTNQARTVTVTCDRMRYVTGLTLDRGHNLSGFAISLLGSNDGFTTSFTIWTGSVPTVVTSPGLLDNANGCVTEEGAFLVRFAGQAAMAFRLSIPALGSGIVAQVVGAWLGMWYAPGYFDRPWNEDGGNIMALEQESSSGWLGSTVPVHRREGTIALRLTQDSDYNLARYHVQGHYFAGRRPMWIVQDDAQADRAVLAIRPKGLDGFTLDRDWFPRRASIPWQEHEPLRIGG